ncbi:MAG: 2-oxo acid dehydrogenase subunit E2 [Actinobacteria bacterium]|nr:2-oxo acid dehydrogenase subunit E2 [Actinomycetota bacterium]
MIEIKMPQLGQTTDEVRIVRWLVKEGQEVKRGEPLCEVETDKTTMELESFTSGTVLKINVEPDTVVNSGAVIALIGKAGEIKGSEKAEKKDEASHGKIEITETALTESRQEFGQEGQDKLKKAAIEEGTQQREYSSEVKATSLVKNLAKIKNIDLRLVKGTGPQGLITRDDLDNFINGKTGGAVKVAGAKEIILTQSQSAVARSLSKSKSEIPHYYLKTEIFADNILKWREKNRSATNEKVSMYSIIVYAVANILMQMPKMNAYFKQNRIILYEDINIGFAVGVEDELFIPVIKNANKKDIMQIDLELKKLVANTSSKKFESGDLSGGTFTISNLGMYDIDEFCAIINPQQSGILAVGKLKKVLHIDESGRMIIRNAFTITGSFDHRFVNGKTGAEFLSKLKHFMENENE